MLTTPIRQGRFALITKKRSRVGDHRGHQSLIYLSSGLHRAGSEHTLV